MLVAQSRPALCDPMDCSPSASSVPVIFKARILEWVAISFSRGSSWPRDPTHVPCVSRIGGQILYHLSQQGSLWKNLLFSHPVLSNLCDPIDCSKLGLPVCPPFPHLPKFMSIALVMPSSHLILWCPLLLLPSIFPSIKDFSNESAVCIRWWKYWSFSFSISTSNEYAGLISLKVDWFNFLAVQGTLRRLQHHSSKAWILWHYAFFTVQLSQRMNHDKYWLELTLTLEGALSRCRPFRVNEQDGYPCSWLSQSYPTLWLHFL